VGRLEVEPGATNVIPGAARASLDVRHADDAVRRVAVERFLRSARQLAQWRGLSVSSEPLLDQPAVALDAPLVAALEQALTRSRYPVHRMTSGAGHDAMIVARRMPAALLFLRSPGGISHHPDENVLPEDVAAALAVGMQFLEQMETRLG